ncbi:LAMI_0C03004g1_1 [Lachancea mirantina]|uniref:Kinetochore protein NDC80 n=1 Tax=Lachancea mirantina TaxID=1230905 RepID=A0A1G4J186_9SACH|nr:LAMI_0C03004g1_1 [Lachancea mirantina]
MEDPKNRHLNGQENSVHKNLNGGRFSSQIPTAMGGRRRNSTESAIGGAGLTDMIHRSMARGKPELNRRAHTETRKSLLSERKSLRTSQRTLLLGSQNQTGNAVGSGTPTSGTNNRDPRPLRDKTFQLALQQEIYDYLSYCKFDIETNHAISLKSLRQPTQKDFIIMFKWLYLRMDPGFRFTKSIENEVYTILRLVQYPYLETINKSQISAVGGTSWPKFLGMLHWLVVTNKRLDSCLQKLDLSITSQNTQELTVLKQPMTTLDDQDDKLEKYELMVERLFIDYILQSYKSFLRLEDDFGPYMQELEAGFTKFSHIIRTDMSHIEATNKELSLRYQKLMEKGHDLKIARDKSDALKSDLTKFQNYINAMQHKSSEWPRKLEKMKAEKQKKEISIKETEVEIGRLRSALKEMHVSVSEIDHKNQERDQITKDLDEVSSKLDQTVSALKSSRVETESAYKALLSTLEQYNGAVDSLCTARNKFNHMLDGSKFELSIPEDLMREEKIGSDPDDLLSPERNVSSIKSLLLTVNTEIQERIHKVQREIISQESELENIKEEISGKNHALELLENELSIVRTELEEYNQESQSLLLSQKIEMEKLERRNQNGRLTSQRKLSLADEKVQETQLRYEELKMNINREKGILCSKIIHLIEFVSNFKISAQGAIERVESLALQELKQLQSSQANKEA